MHYAPIMTLTLAHDYYGDTAPPVTALAADPKALDRAGLLLRQRGRQVIVVSDQDIPRPDRISILLRAETPEIFSLTEGADWYRIAHVTLPEGTETFRFDDLISGQGETQASARFLTRLDVDLPASGAREATLAFAATSSLWTYHLTGARGDDDLQIIDPDGQIAFDDLGVQTLPNGMRAKVLRSADPMPARARPSHKFTLQRPSPFGPETVIPVLPAAGTQFRTVTEDGAAARLQSDIYVTLW